MKRTWKLTQAQRNAIVYLYREGVSVQALAAHFAITKGAVSRLANRRGLRRRRPAA